jgi:flagellar hook protein FlgE
LRRLKDDGDWEPVYLLACGQFAAMNAAEERNGVYYATPASGALKTGFSGKEGMGTITAGALECSTTDLAHELSDMIRAQHAYAANTKVLSTIDDMLEELERL